MKTPRLVGAATLLLLGVGLAVFGYNLWAYSCGHCTLQTLGYVGPFGWLLLGLSAAAGLSLLWLRRRRHRTGAARRCGCGLARDPAWTYCPQCGRMVGTVG
jgi:hypothetical protein